MLTNKDNNEVKLITLESLCLHCVCRGEFAMDSPRWQSFKCTNKAEGCDGFTLCESCPIWVNLQSVISLNVKQH